MKRRTVLGLLGAVSSGVAGCVGQVRHETGPRLPPRPAEGESRPDDGEPDSDSDETDTSLRVDELDFEETDDGRLRVFGTVENPGEQEQSGTVVVTVTVEGNEHERTTDVSVSPKEASTFEFVLDVAFDRFITDGGIQASMK